MHALLCKDFQSESFKYCFQLYILNITPNIQNKRRGWQGTSTAAEQNRLTASHEQHPTNRHGSLSYPGNSGCQSGLRSSISHLLPCVWNQWIFKNRAKWAEIRRRANVTIQSIKSLCSTKLPVFKTITRISPEREHILCQHFQSI